jgi:response regulator RpfG family c-di-GMP phosphodiesterase
MNQSIAQAGIMYIDDTVCKLDDFKCQFRHLFDIYTAPTVNAGQRLLGLHEMAVVIVNQLMPGTSGADFLELVAQTNPRAIRILLTGFSDMNIVSEAFNKGIIHKAIAKPWQAEEMRAAIQNALELYDLRKHNLELTYKLHAANYELDHTLKQRG